METKRIEFQSLWVADYILEDSGEGDLYLLLHGFNQSAKVFYKDVRPALPKGANLLVPNAPFPVPEKQGHRYRLGFSWYFYDYFQNFYFLDQKVAVRFLIQLLKTLNLDSRPLHLIGYSQGGYLAPFFSREYPAVKSLVGLGCQYLESLKPEDFPPAVWQIHGRKDRAVDFDKARLLFEALDQRATSPQQFRSFLALESSHRWDSRYTSALKTLLGQK